jgi:glutaredoxin
VTLYTRRECHLCEDAYRVLTEQQRRYGFSLDVVDVDTSPDLVSRFGDSVPVVAVNGRVRFRGAVNEVLFRRLLAHPPSVPDSEDTGCEGGGSGGAS